MFFHTYYMDGHIQNVFSYMYTKWMAPYRMFFHTYYMDGPIQNVFPYGPIQNVSQNMLNGWPHTE